MNEIKCTLHSHTTYCDGKNTVDEMVESAIAEGCHAIGFSGHSYIKVFDWVEDWCMTLENQKKYQRDVKAAAEKYKDRIDVLLGLELDYYSTAPDYTYEYIIGSVHYVKTPNTYIAVDLSPEDLLKKVDEEYSGDFLAFARDYYEHVADVYNKTKCDIIGHFDLITKFNEKHNFFDENDKKYREYAYDALDALLKTGVPFEVNTGAISRGWKTEAYPSDFILNRIAEKNGAVIINSDTHSKDTILCGYDRAYERVKRSGIKNICTVRNKKITLI